MCFSRFLFWLTMVAMACSPKSRTLYKPPDTTADSSAKGDTSDVTAVVDSVQLVDIAIPPDGLVDALVDGTPDIPSYDLAPESLVAEEVSDAAPDMVETVVEPCLGEGVVFDSSLPNPGCCEELMARPSCEPTGSECEECFTVLRVCVAWGDEICGVGENYCNSVDDCWADLPLDCAEAGGQCTSEQYPYCQQFNLWQAAGLGCETGQDCCFTHGIVCNYQYEPYDQCGDDNPCTASFCIHGWCLNRPAALAGLYPPMPPTCCNDASECPLPIEPCLVGSCVGWSCTYQSDGDCVE
jgi:hypothetical protein